MIKLTWNYDRKIWIVWALYSDIAKVMDIGFAPGLNPTKVEFYYEHYLPLGTFMIACKNAGIDLKVEI